jgi:hypothetical protein
MQNSEQKQESLAWYKIADLIAKKEKEKALSVYRLLSHSFHDKAYILQVEGDILWALDDPGAIAKYKQAALLYRKEQRLIHAISVCEHLLVQNKAEIEIYRILIELYIETNAKEKCNECLFDLYSSVEHNLISADATAKTLYLLSRISQGAEGGSTKKWFEELLQKHKKKMPKKLLGYFNE